MKHEENILGLFLVGEENPYGAPELAFEQEDFVCATDGLSVIRVPLKLIRGTYLPLEKAPDCAALFDSLTPLSPKALARTADFEAAMRSVPRRTSASAPTAAGGDPSFTSTRTISATSTSLTASAPVCQGVGEARYGEHPDPEAPMSVFETPFRWQHLHAFFQAAGLMESDRLGCQLCESLSGKALRIFLPFGIQGLAPAYPQNSLDGEANGYGEALWPVLRCK